MIDEDEYRSRPGDRLLELLEARGMSVQDFAVEAEMAGEPQTWTGPLTRAQMHRRRCHQTMLRYVCADASKRKFPSPEMVCRWAGVLGIDPGVFTSESEGSVDE